MNLLWLVNNVMIKALHTWQINRSYRSNVFNLDTNESLFRWRCFSAVAWAIIGNFVSTSPVSFVLEFHVPQITPVIISYDIDYYQKPASVNVFYKTCLASKFPCLLNFVAAAFQLCAHVRNNDGCPSVNPGLCFDWEETGTRYVQNFRWKLDKSVNFANISNKLTLVFQSQELHLWDKTRKINFPGHKLIFTAQDQNSGLFHGREQNFKFRAFSRFPGFVGTLDITRCHLTSIGNPIVEIRRSDDRLISTMGFPILVRWHLYIESGSRGPSQ